METNDNRKVVIELQDVKRDFMVGDETVHALRGVSFKIYEGEFVTIMGKSGSGKSTLLNQLGCLDTPSSGEYLLIKSLIAIIVCKLIVQISLRTLLISLGALQICLCCV
jgi:ABC-type lipoprotein export system ATPase subunit